MHFNRYTLRRTMLALVLLIIIAYAVFHAGDVGVSFGKLLNLLTPFIAGAVMAFILNVPMRFLEGRVFSKIKSKKFKKFKRPLAVLLSLIIVILLVTLVSVIVIPQLIDSITLFVSNMPEYFAGFNRLLDQVVQRFPDTAEQVEQVRKNIENISPANIQQGIMDFLRSSPDGSNGDNGTLLTSALFSTFGIVTSVFGFLVNAVVGFAFAIYVLFAKEDLAIQGRRLIFAIFSHETAKYVIHVFQVGFAKFYNFLTGQLLEAVILGSLMSIGMLVLQLPYAFMIGVLIGFTALIPIAGAVIGGFIGFLLVFSVSTTKALIFLVFMLLLQQFESNVIYPRVVGSSVGLPSMWTLFAITIGGSLMGLMGMLLFVPLVSTIYSLISEIIYGRLEMKGISEKDPNILYGVPDSKRLKS
ncbi:AI-2E family transporter [Peptococcus simiae]|uniref:AI-2E family transporter n=1 Tax=Peptococcus simiae TaxID=1643805 RepID=A0ABW9GZR8_9FIRM